MRLLSLSAHVREITTLITLALFATLCVAQYTPEGVPYPQRGSLAGENGYGSVSSVVECSVLDQAGIPIEGVAVQISRMDGLAQMSSSFTDSRGLARFDRLSPGQYKVTATVGISIAIAHIEVGALSQPITLVIPSMTAKPRVSSAQKTIPVQQLLVPRKATKEFEKAESAFMKRDDTKARMHIERALSIYPTYAHALALRGILQLMAGDRDSGSKDLELAVQYDPALVRAYVALANVYNDRHEFDRSSKMAEKAKLLAPRFWQGYYEAARANLGRGNFDDALSNAQEAERLASGDFKSAASLARASALIGKGDNEKAAVLLRVLLARPLPPAQEELAKNFLTNLSH